VLPLTALVLFLAQAPSTSAGQVQCKAGDPGVTPPRVLPESRVLPVAPPASIPPGRFILRVLVAVDGRVADLEVLRAPYGGEALKADVLASVLAWRYEPARRDDAAIACWMVESVEFGPHTTTPSAAPAAAPEPLPAARPVAAPGREAPAPERPATAPAPAPMAEPVAAAPLDAPQPTPGRESAEPAIDLTRGGPPPLEIGGSGQEAAQFLGADAAADSFGAADRGLQVALVDREGTRRVGSIRYLFADGRDGFRASPLRTRSGLGKGSACLGIPAAQGRPTTRAVVVEEGGVTTERLRYESGDVVATFLCVDGRLAELTIAAAERAGPD